MKKLILVGTDHRLRQSVSQDPRSKKWAVRTGGRNFRRLVVHCIDKLGAQAIFEEIHPKQEELAPTICSQIAKDRALKWESIGSGEPNHSDALFDRSSEEARRLPVMLAGRYVLNTHRAREEYMRARIAESLERHGCVLAVVGFMHLAALAYQFDADKIEVEPLIFTFPLVVNEAIS
jgi:hypothetical protein